MDTYAQDEVLFGTTVCLLKKASQDEAGLWKFGGIASSESVDEEGDTILKKVLDLSYLQKRGYVNWDHSRQPSDQLGFTTKASIIQTKDLAMYEDLLGSPLSKHVSVYVEGCLYQNVKKAQEVHDILKSIPPGEEGALGLSVDGAMIRSESRSVLRALVRGVAMTPVPAHPDTLCRLVKSLRSGVAIAVDHTPGAGGSDGQKILTFNDSLALVQEMFPGVTFERAKRMVKAVFDQKRGETR